METPNFLRKEDYKHPFYLILELMEKDEKLVFPGINSESYNVLKLEEESLPNYSDFATPIDEIIEDCREWGLRIMPGNGQEALKLLPGTRIPDCANAFLLPANSNNLNDSIRLKHLNIDLIEDTDFKKLIKLLLK